MKNKILLAAFVLILAGCSTTPYCQSNGRKCDKAVTNNLEGTGVEVTTVGNKIYLTMPGSVTFDTGSSNVKASFDKVLNSVAQTINVHSDSDVMVVGHTDSTGSDAINDKLSKERAEAVAAKLKAKGVKSNMTTEGRGSKEPLASNATPEGREKNRRIEVILENI